ncbi:MAG: hypothetical protein ABI333_21515 [bacterium]
MVSSSIPPSTGSDGINWQERRRQALSTIELYKANLTALNACGVEACQMRYAFIGGEKSFLFSFEDEMPRGRIALTFPMTYPENYEAEGWKKLILTLDVSTDKQLLVSIRGRYERDEVPFDIDVEFLRTLRGGRGIGRDVVSVTDTRSGEVIDSSMEQVIEEKHADGNLKYCRKSDTLRDMSVEGFIAILSRYFKDCAIRRRASLR